jgi:hypothetical protein
MCSQAVELTGTCRLLDGRLVSLRRLGADDAEAVLTLHQRLTDHDRYFRFFTLHPGHLDELVGKLIQAADGQYALGAFDGDRLIGVASYTVSEDPSAAEIAIVVPRGWSGGATRVERCGGVSDSWVGLAGPRK